MLESIFFSLWFFAPAGLANLAAFVSGKNRFLKKFNYPVDCYLKFRGRRLLGSHKTIRGFIAAIIVGSLVCLLEALVYELVPAIRTIVPFNYAEITPVWLGALLGFGALLGDSVKSFFKRQAGIQPGRSWFPFDQIDYILGGIVFSLLYIQLSVLNYILIFIVWSLIHPLATFIGFLLKLRRKPL